MIKQMQDHILRLFDCHTMANSMAKIAGITQLNVVAVFTHATSFPF